MRTLTVSTPVPGTTPTTTSVQVVEPSDFTNGLPITKGGFGGTTLASAQGNVFEYQAWPTGVTDFDNLPINKSGFYKYETTTTIANQPPGLAGWFYVHVDSNKSSGSGLRARVSVFKDNSVLSAERIYNGTAWSDWKLSTDRATPALTQIIAVTDETAETVLAKMKRYNGGVIADLASYQFSAAAWNACTDRPAWLAVNVQEWLQTTQRQSGTFEIYASSPSSNVVGRAFITGGDVPTGGQILGWVLLSGDYAINISDTTAEPIYTKMARSGMMPLNKGGSVNICFPANAWAAVTGKPNGIFTGAAYIRLEYRDGTGWMNCYITSPNSTQVWNCIVSSTTQLSGSQWTKLDNMPSAVVLDTTSETLYTKLNRVGLPQSVEAGSAFYCIQDTATTASITDLPSGLTPASRIQVEVNKFNSNTWFCKLYNISAAGVWESLLPNTTWTRIDSDLTTVNTAWGTRATP